MPANPKFLPTDRRAASAKRDSDVIPSAWPMIAKSAYDECFRKPEAMNPKMRSLCVARIRLGHALHALDKARQDWAPHNSGNGLDQGVYMRLRGIRETIERQYFKFPIDVK